MAKLVVSIFFVVIAGIFNALGSYTLSNSRYNFLYSINSSFSFYISAVVYFVLNLLFFRLSHQGLSLMLSYLILVSVTAVVLWKLSGGGLSVELVVGFLFVLVGNLLIFRSYLS